MDQRDVGRMGYERWRVLECWSSVTRQPPATSMTKLGLSAGVLVRARAAHEVEPLAFQDGPAIVEALPNASLLHRGIIVAEHVMPKLGSCIPRCGVPSLAREA